MGDNDGTHHMLLQVQLHRPFEMDVSGCLLLQEGSFL